MEKHVTYDFDPKLEASARSLPDNDLGNPRAAREGMEAMMRGVNEQVDTEY
jgi:hypothetical protein